jgi:hypothetical protein
MKFFLLFFATLGAISDQQLTDAALKRFEEIHAKHSDEPKGIWYGNYLATLLEKRSTSLYFEDWTGYLDEDDFEKTGSITFRLKKGRPATAALQKAIDGLSVLDCGNATQLVYYLAISDAVGQKAFDAYVEKSDKPLYIATYTKNAPKDSIFFDLMTYVEIPQGSHENNRPLKPGQLAYFRNYKDYLNRHPSGDAQGYNTIYLGRNSQGDQQYMAMWNGPPKTEQEIVALLKKRYFQPQDNWDLKRLKELGKEPGKMAIDPNHTFFKERGLYTYIFNIEQIKKIF